MLFRSATWQKIHRDITAVIAGYGAKFSQPEGGGGFGDDPVAWVTEGNFRNIYDYGLGIWWQKSARPLVESVEQRNPEILERALRAYHDRVVAAGGTLYFPVPKVGDPEAQAFAEALIATSGDMPCYCDPIGGITRPAKGIPELLKLKVEHPALFQNSLRRRIATDDDVDIYAVERYAAQDAERLLLVFNFGDHPVQANIEVAAVAGSRYRDLLSHQVLQPVEGRLPIRLAPHTYQIFTILGYGSGT